MSGISSSNVFGSGVKEPYWLPKLSPEDEKIYLQIDTPEDIQEPQEADRPVGAAAFENALNQLTPKLTLYAARAAVTSIIAPIIPPELDEKGNEIPGRVKLAMKDHQQFFDLYYPTNTYWNWIRHHLAKIVYAICKPIIGWRLRVAMDVAKKAVDQAAKDEMAPLLRKVTKSLSDYVVAYNKTSQTWGQERTAGETLLDLPDYVQTKRNEQLRKLNQDLKKLCSDAEDLAIEIALPWGWGLQTLSKWWARHHRPLYATVTSLRDEKVQDEIMHAVHRNLAQMLKQAYDQLKQPTHQVDLSRRELIDLEGETKQKLPNAVQALLPAMIEMLRNEKVRSHVSNEELPDMLRAKTRLEKWQDWGEWSDWAIDVPGQLRDPTTLNWVTEVIFGQLAGANLYEYATSAVTYATFALDQGKGPDDAQARKQFETMLRILCDAAFHKYVVHDGGTAKPKVTAEIDSGGADFAHLSQTMDESIDSLSALHAPQIEAIVRNICRSRTKLGAHRDYLEDEWDREAWTQYIDAINAIKKIPQNKRSDTLSALLDRLNAAIDEKRLEPKFLLLLDEALQSADNPQKTAALVAKLELLSTELAKLTVALEHDKKGLYFREEEDRRVWMHQAKQVKVWVDGLPDLINAEEGIDLKSVLNDDPAAFAHVERLTIRFNEVEIGRLANVLEMELATATEQRAIQIRKTVGSLDNRLTPLGRAAHSAEWIDGSNITALHKTWMTDESQKVINAALKRIINAQRDLERKLAATDRVRTRFRDEQRRSDETEKWLAMITGPFNSFVVKNEIESIDRRIKEAESTLTSDQANYGEVLYLREVRRLLAAARYLDLLKSLAKEEQSARAPLDPEIDTTVQSIAKKQETLSKRQQAQEKFKSLTGSGNNLAELRNLLDNQNLNGEITTIAKRNDSWTQFFATELEIAVQAEIVTLTQELVEARSKLSALLEAHREKIVGHHEKVTELLEKLKTMGKEIGFGGGANEDPIVEHDSLNEGEISLLKSNRSVWRKIKEDRMREMRAKLRAGVGEAIMRGVSPKQLLGDEEVALFGKLERFKQKGEHRATLPTSLSADLLDAAEHANALRPVRQRNASVKKTPLLPANTAKGEISKVIEAIDAFEDDGDIQAAAEALQLATKTLADKAPVNYAPLQSELNATVAALRASHRARMTQLASSLRTLFRQMRPTVDMTRWWSDDFKFKRSIPLMFKSPVVWLFGQKGKKRYMDDLRAGFAKFLETPSHQEEIARVVLEIGVGILQKATDA